MGIVFGTLALSALFMAQGTTRLLAAAVLGPDAYAGVAASGEGRGAVAPGAKVRQRRDPTPILQKNIFDSQSGDLTARPEVAFEMGEDGLGEVDLPGDDSTVGTCSGGGRLVGTIVAPGRPEWSFAALADSTGKAMLFRAGMPMGDHTLVGIRPDRVYMAPRSGSLCQLQMFSVGDEPAPARAKPKAKADDDDDAQAELRERLRGRQEGALSEEELEKGIEKVSDSQFNIDRSLVSKILENQAELMRSARIIPHEVDGRAVGVKLYGIRRNSVLGALGMQNGDMLRNINGFDMTSPDSALQAYTKLQSAERLSVAIERRGKPMTVEYNVR
jgi:general secretion pathway protein C